MGQALSNSETMKSVVDQYLEHNVTVTTGHEPDLNRVSVPLYSDEEHETWAMMFNRQLSLLPQRASREFLQALQYMNLPQHRIPTLKEVNQKLYDATGWKVTRVEGLVPEKEFFECLAQKLFPCTDFIRKRHELEYTPSPDMFHDIFGHLPLITNPTFASFYEFYGKASLTATPEQLTALQRIYWFTVEFGLIKNPEGTRIYGSGILSSVGEVEYCLGPKVKRHDFDFEKVSNQSFEIFHMQDDLFVIEGFEELLDGFCHWARKEGLV